MKNQNFELVFSRGKGRYLAFSIPQSNHYQEINNLSLRPQPHTVTKVGENNLTIFILNDVKEKVRLGFFSKPKSLLMSIDKNYKITDCPKKQTVHRDFINSENPAMKKMAARIIGREERLATAVSLLYRHTVRYLTYGNPIEGLHSYRQALKERKTDCGGFSTFLASLLEAVGIPTRLVVGYVIRPSIFKKCLVRFGLTKYGVNSLFMHAWLEILLPDRSWFPIDPSEKLFGRIPADRLVTSFGYNHTMKIDGQTLHADILQKPLYYD